jgi:hypothetical protein
MTEQRREPTESHEDWARRVIAEGPPPPKAVLDRVARMKANAASKRPA